MEKMMMDLADPLVLQTVEKLGLKQDALHEYYKIFRMFDADGDGSVTLDELAMVMRSMGRDLENEELQEMLSSFDVDYYRRMFQLFDNDEDGSISVKELHTVLQSFGHDTSEESVRRIMSDYDKDGDGAIEFPEFLTAISKIMNDADSETELIEIFRIIDQDGDGTISKSDLREVSKRIGLSLSNRDMDDMFEVADKDSDGRVDFEEFSKIILSRH